MKIVLKASLYTCLILVALGMSLYFATRGDYPMRPLVTQDPALPSQMIGATKLHMRIVAGPADATTLIVLHGGPGGDFRSLQGLDILSDQYRIVYYDQRGAGLSERVDDERLTLDGHIMELDEVIQFASPDASPVLIGHSWGAILATAYLGRYPDRIAKAVLIEPGFLNATGRQQWQEQSRRYMSGPSYWRKAVLTGFRAQHVSGPDPSAPDDFLIGHMVETFVKHQQNPYHCGAGYAAPGWRFGADASRMLANISARDLDSIAANAERFQGQVLLMAGACNAWTGPDLQKGHQSFFNQAEVAVVNDAGHDVIWDNPDISLVAIRDFLIGTNGH